MYSKNLYCVFIIVSGNQDALKPAETARSNRYRPEIDGLRAFAVIAVIINHFQKNFSRWLS